MAKFCQNADLWRKVKSAQFLSNSATPLSSDSRNSYSADCLESWNEPSESGESYLEGWYSAIWEFQFRLALGILFLPIVVLSSSVFSSFTDGKNSVSSKPLVQWGSISNRWKSGRVVQLFGIQLRGRIPPKLQNCSFQKTHRRANSHRTWTVDRMKASKYPLESWGCPLPCCYLTLKQYQIEIFWLLHVVKAEATSLFVFPVRRWCCWIERSYSLRGFQMLSTYS
jgi:hypothetical protein